MSAWRKTWRLAHHALAFSPRLSEGYTLLCSVHTCVPFATSIVVSCSLLSGGSFGNVSGGLPNQPTHESCVGHWVTRWRSDPLTNHRLHFTTAGSVFS